MNRMGMAMEIINLFRTLILAYFKLGNSKDSWSHRFTWQTVSPNWSIPIIISQVLRKGVEEKKSFFFFFLIICFKNYLKNVWKIALFRTRLLKKQVSTWISSLRDKIHLDTMMWLNWCLSPQYIYETTLFNTRVSRKKIEKIGFSFLSFSLQETNNFFLWKLHFSTQIFHPLYHVPINFKSA